MILEVFSNLNDSKRQLLSKRNALTQLVSGDMSGWGQLGVRIRRLPQPGAQLPTEP